MENKQWPLPSHNETFDCVIHIETELPKGEKSGGKYDALSLIIIELNYSSHRDGRAGIFHQNLSSKVKRRDYGRQTCLAQV